ncbi:MAG: TatD family hydrolase [Acidobacteria bacterium]|nr:TatD family hydrolase [Acidobacteriota bacterium]
MARLTDSHCHLAMYEGADDAIARSRAAGLRGIVVPATRLDDLEACVRLAEANGDVWAAVGFHPHEAKDFDDDAAATVERLASHPRVVAIGEIGLDYHYDHSPREIQRQVFARQIAIANRAGLPVIVHNRESIGDLVETIESGESSGVRGVLHSYTESYEVATTLIDRGFFISFSGILTFRSAQALRDVAKRLPRDRVLIETDTPYLAPVPHRGQRNEPAWVERVAETLAELWEIPFEGVAEITTRNFESAFGVSVGS